MRLTRAFCSRLGAVTDVPRVRRLLHAAKHQGDRGRPLPWKSARVSSLPYRLKAGGEARFEFNLAGDQAEGSARLRLHTADQSKTDPTIVVVDLNGRKAERALPKGLGVQSRDPAHLAFPATIDFAFSGSDLRKGKNTLTVAVKGDGWFSWDALDLVNRTSPPATTTLTQQLAPR